MNLSAVALAGIISAPNMMMMFFAIVVRTGIILGTLQISQRFVRNGRRMMENDYISRQAAIEVIDAVFPVDSMKSEYAQGIACGAALAKTYIEQLPSADVVPVVHGTWECHMSFGICNKCGYKYNWTGADAKNFCPNCGAKM